jgi:FAD/FMN-containing dehydrogenase
MGAEAKQLDRALAALRGVLGPDGVLAGTAATNEIERRSLNPVRFIDPVAPNPEDGASLRYLVRPRNTEECRLAVATLTAAGCDPNPIAGLTTFWEPPASGSGVGVDTLELKELFRIDPLERIAYCGAGITVREVDRLARREGLCLVAYPDSDGSQSVGSMAAVACTTGLGGGRIEPVEQVVGLTIVTRDAAVLKTGAAWRLGRGGAAHGMPDPAGIFLGAQGRFGVIAEVVLKLWPAPFLAARTWSRPWLAAGELATGLRLARQGLDLGAVDSLRLETVAAGDAPPDATEWFVRCWGPDSAATADERCAAVARILEARDARRWVESAAARRGDLPDYDERFSVPPGEHHARTGRDGFLGVEVNVNWGDQLDSALRLFAELFENLAACGLGHRRLGIYPGAHVVSIGVQCMLSGGAATATTVCDALAGCVASLTALGAVPYRAGRLWQRSMERLEVDDPACAVVRRAGLAEGAS